MVYRGAYQRYVDLNFYVLGVSTLINISTSMKICIQESNCFDLLIFLRSWTRSVQVLGAERSFSSYASAQRLIIGCS